MPKDAIPVVATTITMGAEMMPAATADCPITKAPTILTADQLPSAAEHRLHEGLQT